jgi:hypothetical protein
MSDDVKGGLLRRAVRRISAEDDEIDDADLQAQAEIRRRHVRGPLR